MKFDLRELISPPWRTCPRCGKDNQFVVSNLMKLENPEVM